MKTDSEKLDFIYNYIMAQSQPVAPQPEYGDFGLPFNTYPTNLPVMTYTDAENAVAALGDGWRIPTLEELRLMYKNKGIIGGFITKYSGSDFPDWYWSSTENRDDPSLVHIVRFSDGGEYWSHKDFNRLSCRPVRLVAAPSLG